MKRITYRQGDVLITKVDTIPASTTPIPRESGRIVIARGEVTGHSHAITSGRAEFVIANETLRRYLNASAPVVLHHEEHGEILLPAGLYEVEIQREYHPQEIRNVCD